MPRRRDDEDADETPVKKGHNARADDDSNEADADDDDTPAPAKGKRNTQTHGISLDDRDAQDSGGLFGPGRATITSSEFAPFTYGDTASRNPPIVWLITFTRGKGKEKESYEQPYTMGNAPDWKLDKHGRLSSGAGHKSLPRGCNATVHLVKPARVALEAAGYEVAGLNDPASYVGMEVELDRVEQEKRDIRQGSGSKRRDAGRPQQEDKGRERTILQIMEVYDAPEFAKSKGGAKKKAKPMEDADDVEEQDEEEAAPVTKGKSKNPVKAAREEDDDRADDSLEEEAVEALLMVVESGKVKVGHLKDRLQTVLGKRKDAAAIIDLALTIDFLQKELGWVYDGKTVDAADDSTEEAEEEEDEAPAPKRRGR